MDALDAFDEAYIIWAHGTAFEKALAKDSAFSLEQLMLFDEKGRHDLIEQAYPDFVPEVIDMYGELEHIRIDPQFHEKRHVSEWQQYRAIRRSMRGFNFLGGLKSRIYN